MKRCMHFVYASMNGLVTLSYLLNDENVDSSSMLNHCGADSWIHPLGEDSPTEKRTWNTSLFSNEFKSKRFFLFFFFPTTLSFSYHSLRLCETNENQSSQWHLLVVISHTNGVISFRWFHSQFYSTSTDVSFEWTLSMCCFHRTWSRESDEMRSTPRLLYWRTQGMSMSRLVKVKPWQVRRNGVTFRWVRRPNDNYQTWLWSQRTRSDIWTRHSS